MGEDCKENSKTRNKKLDYNLQLTTGNGKKLFQFCTRLYSDACEMRKTKVLRGIFPIFFFFFFVFSFRVIHREVCTTK